MNVQLITFIFAERRNFTSEFVIDNSALLRSEGLQL